MVGCPRRFGDQVVQWLGVEEGWLTKITLMSFEFSRTIECQNLANYVMVQAKHLRIDWRN